MRNRHAMAAPVKGSFIRRTSRVLSSSTTEAFNSAAPTPPVTMGSVMSPVSLTWISQTPFSRTAGSGWAMTAKTSSSAASASGTWNSRSPGSFTRLPAASTIIRRLLTSVRSPCLLLYCTVPASGCQVPEGGPAAEGAFFEMGEGLRNAIIYAILYP